MGGRKSRTKALTLGLAATVFAAIAPSGAVVEAAARDDGVTRRQVTIGYHVPMTGAVPLPNESARKGAELYWRWLRERNRRIDGRYVRPIVRNDNYNPAAAVAACKQMVEEDHVFMLAGVIQGSGVNQVVSCARYAKKVGVPYVSLGMTRADLQLPRYFAITATWPREARLVADFLLSERRARRATNGIVWMNSPTFADTHKAFANTMGKRGATLDYETSVPKGASQTDAERVVAEMKTLGVENVFVLASPVWFLQVLQSARTQNFNPLWTGTSTIATSGDAVPRVGCRNGNFKRSRFVSPLPAFGDRDDFDPRHDRAMRTVFGERGDSITWLGWAGSKAIARLLDGVGRDLTRRRFVRVTERDRKITTEILPRFGFRPRDHFGGRAVHLLRANCQEERWETVRRFVNDF